MAVEGYAVAVEGLSGLKSVDELPQDILQAAQRAINGTTDWAYANAGREMRKQVNFAARYLTGAEGRLRIAQKASGTNLESRIVGRHRPTSLARFSRGNPGKAGVSVEVKPGVARFMRRAFLMRLRAGSAALDTRSNLGLAIRTKPGQRPDAAYKPLPIGNNLWLLYGPAVTQVFDDVAVDMSPETLDRLEAEFARLMEL